MFEYTVQVKLANGVLQMVTIQATSASSAKEMARAYGNPLAVTESRPLSSWPTR